MMSFEEADNLPQDTMLLTANILTSGERITLEADMGHIDDVLKVMERFLLGCGYVLEGQLQVVPVQIF